MFYTFWITCWHKTRKLRFNWFYKGSLSINVLNVTVNRTFYFTQIERPHTGKEGTTEERQYTTSNDVKCHVFIKLLFFTQVQMF